MFVLVLAYVHRIISIRGLIAAVMAVSIGICIWVVLLTLKAVRPSLPADDPVNDMGKGSSKTTGAQEFQSVWYLAHANRWLDFNLLAYHDIGTLTVRENMAEFKGTKRTVLIEDIQRVSFGKQGRDFVNNWVKIEYGKSELPSVAYFADGTSRGWGGIYGGTERILAAVKACCY
jgi:hypothetical protein